MAASIKVEALRKLGEMLKATPRAKGEILRGSISAPRGNDAETLADLGLTKKESAVAQKLAALPEKAKERMSEGGAIGGAGKQKARTRRASVWCKSSTRDQVVAEESIGKRAPTLRLKGSGAEQRFPALPGRRAAHAQTAKQRELPLAQQVHDAGPRVCPAIEHHAFHAKRRGFLHEVGLQGGKLHGNCQVAIGPFVAGSGRQDGPPERQISRPNSQMRRNFRRRAAGRCHCGECAGRAVASGFA